MKIGVVIACHNNLSVLKQTIPSIYSDNYFIVLFDDNSTDKTEEWVNDNYSKINIVKGDGNNWWTGAVKKSIEICLNNNCDYIFSLNADVISTTNIINKLIYISKKNKNAIVASVVVNNKKPDEILWAGSKFIRIHNLIPIYTSKYISKAGTKLSKLGTKIYEVDEVHGRGVIIPKEVFEKIGNYNSKLFPHYGGDSDFSLRAKKAGIKMFVDPNSVSKIFVENTGLSHTINKKSYKKVVALYNYLFKRKNGEAFFVLWRLYYNNIPIKYFLQTYLFNLFLNVYRKLIKK